MLKRLRRLVMFVLVLGLGLWSVRTYLAIKHVLTYRPLVQEVLATAGNLANEDLVLAMIYTESKGQADDVIQSSESLTGLPGTITDSRESIRQGVTFLTSNIELAEQAHVDVWTAVQAYNFGQAYIDYVAARGGKTSVTLARTYSREVVAPSLGNTTGETYAYYHPVSMWYGESALYRNGGNYYYAKQVQINLTLIKLVATIEEN